MSLVKIDENQASQVATIEEIPAIKLLLERADNVRSKVMSTKTDPLAVHWKDGGNGQKFPYVTGAYMDNEFKKHFKLYSFKIVKTEVILELCWIIVTVEATDRITGNTEMGVGAARIQINKNARAKVERGDRINQFDLVNLDANIKSARTQAKKDAIKEFGICADVYERIIVPPEVLASWEREFKQIINENVVDPIYKNKWLTYWNNSKNKQEALEKAREEFNIQVEFKEEEEQTKENNT